VSPTSGDGPELLADASVAVALVMADQQHHAQTAKAVGDRRLGLAGHAVFETYSVLCRLPAPLRRTPRAIRDLLARDFPYSRFLSADGAGALLDRLPSLGITGGAVYDALVAAAAAEHGITLATRDQRAVATYRSLDVHFDYIG
jgi:predicted nucleic acid-binding protein